MSKGTGWKAGQEVAFRQEGRVPQSVVVERVTPSGIAVIGERQFNPDGRQRGERGSLWATPPKIEPMTPEIALLIQRHADFLPLMQEAVRAAGRLESMLRHQRCAHLPMTEARVEELRIVVEHLRAIFPEEGA